jgi:hypothetical protein
MKARYLLVVLVAVLATAGAVDAAPNVVQVAKDALKVGKGAQKTGKKALRAAGAAQSTANQANGTAGTALGLAQGANGKADQALARPVLNAGALAEVAGPENFYASGDVGSSIAFCPAGQRAISGGGAAITEVADGVAVSEADAGRTAWFVIAGNNGSVDASIQAFAYCAPVGGAVAASTSRATVRREVEGRIRDFMRARASKSCGAGYTHANLSWGEKCLRAGQFCKRNKNGEYHRFGYHCKSNGHLRRW